jgi:hypothetical protein
MGNDRQFCSEFRNLKQVQGIRRGDVVLGRCSDGHSEMDEYLRNVGVHLAAFERIEPRTHFAVVKLSPSVTVFCSQVSSDGNLDDLRLHLLVY